MKLRLFAAIASMAPLMAAAQDLASCARIDEGLARLACYDKIAGRARPNTPAPTAPTLEQKDTVAQEIKDPDAGPPPSAAAVATSTPLGLHWELDPGTTSGLFKLQAHKQNYLLPVRWSSSVNDAPFRPIIAQSNSPNLGLDAAEAKFQISLKAKAAEGLFGGRADVWLAYTQQSHWQVYNPQGSRPFRETDYEPEAMMVVHTDYDLLGLRGRFVNFGLVHQSNGRTDPLSRSWNRAYAQVGFERGDFALLIRPWYRFREGADTDNNPDITSYIGRGDVLAVYKYGRQEFSLLARSTFNLKEPRGSAQFDWSFPLAGRLKGYFQLFNGYGESLIDYNWRQTT
ncbi:MAG: phospholipase A, partial [Betaproteobacteria bacterium]